VAVRQEELLDHLVELARRLEFEVRFERGSFRDGSCRLQDKRVIVLNRTSPVSRKVTAVSNALKEQPLEGIFLLPAVREAIDNALESESNLELENHHG
jgi:hypothetical protein